MRCDDAIDAELVRRTLAGDREAFGLLYDRHARYVRVVAADAGRARVEDVVQEAFLWAYRGLPTLRSHDGFAQWLVGITRKIVRELRRRAQGERLPAALADARPGPTAATDDADEADHLRSLLERLPEPQRAAVQFFFLSGRKVDEVARLVGRSRSGTYALIQQALATLARWMGGSVPPGMVRR